MGGTSSCVAANYTGTNSDPDPTSTTYADLKIGEKFQHGAFCEYCGGGNPVNCGSAEFTPSGDGSKCTCRALCTAGCCRKLCQRVSFKGDPGTCCTTGSKVIAKGQTCDFKYRTYTTPDCNQYMTTYCKDGQNFFNGKCKEWVNLQREAADDVILTVCNRPENATRPECGCVVASNDMIKRFGSDSKVAVECVDNRCTNGGTKTYQQFNNPCNVVNCDMNFDALKLLVTGDHSTLNASFVQKCGSEYDKIVASKPPDIGTTPVPTPSADTTDRKNWSNVFSNLSTLSGSDFTSMNPPAIFCVVSCLLFLVIIGLIIKKMKNKATNKTRVKKILKS
jgi:hypothetical protein